MSLDAEVMADIEGDAEAILQLAGADPCDGLSSRELCLQLLGTAPRFAALRSEAELCRVGPDWQVFVRRGTAPERARWLVCHELAEWWYQRHGHRCGDIEQRCDALGAALVAPRRVVAQVRRLVGDDYLELASRLRTTQSLALLRIGEVTGIPAAVVRQRGAIVRGEPYVWPLQLELAKARRTRHHAVRRVRITDEERRVGLVAVA